MKYTIKDYEDLKLYVENLSIEELLRCVVCPDIRFNEGYVPTTETLSQMFHETDVENAKKLTDYINLKTDGNMLFAADLECGAGRAVDGLTRFPSLMACGVIGDESLAYKMGEVCAVEAKRVGYSWTFAPCVDIIFNRDNPIVNTRGIGEDADKVIKIAGAYMRGVQDNGIIATLKHFPGDGICEYDQHLTTPENTLSMDEWETAYGKVYRTLIEDGVKSIMPGHISLPAYDDKDEELGMYPPATLSKKLLTDLLKKELGFNGIIISDAVNMGGFCGFMNLYEAYCTFLEAGGDCLLFAHPNEKFFAEMKKGIDNGFLSVETLKNRAYRMLCFVREYKETDRTEQNITQEQAKAISNEIVEKSCRIVRDRKNNIPFAIKKETRVMHLVITNNYADEDIKRFTKELGKYSDNVVECIDPGPDYIYKVIEDNTYDLVICTVGCQPSYGLNSVRLHGNVARNMMMGWSKLDTPVIFVNYGNPWLGDEYKAVIDTLINTHGCTDYTAEFVVNKIING